MKYFLILYKLQEKRGRMVIKASTKIEALNSFLDLEVGIPIEVREITQPLSLKLKESWERLKSPIANKEVKLEPYIALLEQLAVMLEAGLALNFALKQVLKTQKDPMLKAIFLAIYEDIESGKSLYESAKRFKKQLGAISLSLFHLGEETGTLAQELAHLAQILSQISQNRQKVKKATRYPLFILLSMGVSFVVVTLMVIPKFENFFKEMEMELPLPTRFILGFKDMIVEYGVGLLVGGAGGIVVGVWLYRKFPKVRFYLDKTFLKLFVIGKATYYAMLSRFLYIFKVLYSSGVPILEALQIAGEVVENEYLKKRLLAIPTAIQEGKPLYQGFQNSQLFEEMVIEMIKSGELGGGLPKMVQKVTTIYSQRFEYIVENIIVLLEPILIAVIAGFVLTLALGIFLPMWNLTQMVQ